MDEDSLENISVSDTEVKSFIEKAVDDKVEEFLEDEYNINNNRNPDKSDSEIDENDNINNENSNIKSVLHEKYCNKIMEYANQIISFALTETELFDSSKILTHLKNLIIIITDGTIQYTPNEQERVYQQILIDPLLNFFDTIIDKLWINCYKFSNDYEMLAHLSIIICKLTEPVNENLMVKIDIGKLKNNLSTIKQKLASNKFFNGITKLNDEIMSNISNNYLSHKELNIKAKIFSRIDELENLFVHSLNTNYIDEDVLLIPNNTKYKTSDLLRLYNTKLDELVKSSDYKKKLYKKAFIASKELILNLLCVTSNCDLYYIDLIFQLQLHTYYIDDLLLSISKNAHIRSNRSENRINSLGLNLGSDTAIFWRFTILLFNIFRTIDPYILGKYLFTFILKDSNLVTHIETKSNVKLYYVDERTVETYENNPNDTFKIDLNIENTMYISRSSTFKVKQVKELSTNISNIIKHTLKGELARYTKFAALTHKLRDFEAIDSGEMHLLFGSIINCICNNDYHVQLTNDEIKLLSNTNFISSIIQVLNNTYDYLMTALYEDILNGISDYIVSYSCIIKIVNIQSYILCLLAYMQQFLYAIYKTEEIEQSEQILNKTMTTIAYWCRTCLNARSIKCLTQTLSKEMKKKSKDRSYVLLRALARMILLKRFWGYLLSVRKENSLLCQLSRRIIVELSKTKIQNSILRLINDYTNSNNEAELLLYLVIFCDKFYNNIQYISTQNNRKKKFGNTELYLLLKHEFWVKLLWLCSVKDHIPKFAILSVCNLLASLPNNKKISLIWDLRNLLLIITILKAVNQNSTDYISKFLYNFILSGIKSLAEGFEQNKFLICELIFTSNIVDKNFDPIYLMKEYGGICSEDFTIDSSEFWTVQDTEKLISTYNLYKYLSESQMLNHFIRAISHKKLESKLIEFNIIDPFLLGGVESIVSIRNNQINCWLTGKPSNLAEAITNINEIEEDLKTILKNYSQLYDETTLGTLITILILHLEDDFRTALEIITEYIDQIISHRLNTLLNKDIQYEYKNINEAVDKLISTPIGGILYYMLFFVTNEKIIIETAPLSSLYNRIRVIKYCLSLTKYELTELIEKAEVRRTAQYRISTDVYYKIANSISNIYKLDNELLISRILYILYVLLCSNVSNTKKLYIFNYKINMNGFQNTINQVNKSISDIYEELDKEGNKLNNLYDDINNELINTFELNLVNKLQDSPVFNQIVSQNQQLLCCPMFELEYNIDVQILLDCLCGTQTTLMHSTLWSWNYTIKNKIKIIKAICFIIVLTHQFRNNKKNVLRLIQALKTSITEAEAWEILFKWVNDELEIENIDYSDDDSYIAKKNNSDKIINVDKEQPNIVISDLENLTKQVNTSKNKVIDNDKYIVTNTNNETVNNKEYMFNIYGTDSNIKAVFNDELLDIEQNYDYVYRNHNKNKYYAYKIMDDQIDNDNSNDFKIYQNINEINETNKIDTKVSENKVYNNRATITTTNNDSFKQKNQNIYENFIYSELGQIDNELETLNFTNSGDDLSIDQYQTSDNGNNIDQVEFNYDVQLKKEFNKYVWSSSDDEKIFGNMESILD